jgi:hypothetical protein
MTELEVLESINENLEVLLFLAQAGFYGVCFIVGYQILQLLFAAVDRRDFP